MNSILKAYSEYFPGEQTFFKSFLNEIIQLDKEQKKNNGKKLINQKEIDDSVKVATSSLDEKLKKEGITDEDLEWIDEEKIFSEIFGLSNKDTESCLLFGLYPWEVNSKNDALFMRRNTILQYLEEKWIIKISPFNYIQQINNIENEEDVDFKSMLLLWKKMLIDKHGEDIINRQLSALKWKEKYFPCIIFDVKKIRSLLNLLKESDIQEFKYKNKVLRYGGKCIYAPRKDSDRDVFLDMIFNKKKWTYFSLKSIYQELEWGEQYYLSKEQSKKIYNIKDKINKKIQDETWVVKFFSLWVWDNKGDIYRKY